MSLERPPSSANPMPSALPSDSEGHAAYRVTLPEFEGPLDLLLHLCQTHELDILNISIAFIAEKYIEYLEVMTNMSVEVAADYLVMAAHLAYLKSRELVPSPEPLEVSEDGEDPIDPREELIRRLLQYQKYKNAAESLSNRPIEGRNVFVRGAILEPFGEAGLAEHSVWKLLEHWAQILEKAKPQYTHDVVVDRMSIADRINQIVDLLETHKGMVRFEELLGTDLPEAELRHKVVVSLLAVLELAKLHVVRILQQVETGSFFLAQTEGANLADARHLMVTSAREKETTESTKANTAPMVNQGPAETSPAESPANQASTGATTGDAPVEEPAAAAAEAPTSEEPNEALTDETLTDETLTDETLTDETLTDETLTDETLTDETLTDETLTDETLTDETLTDENLTVSATADEPFPVEETATAVPVDEPLPVEETAAAAEAPPLEVPAAAVVEATPVEATPVEATPVEEPAAVAATDEPSPVEEPTAEAAADEVPAAAEVAESTPVEEPATVVSTDEPCPVEEPTAEPAADEAPVAEVPAVLAETETDIASGDTAQLVPQEDVISAPFPASAEGGEEVIDGQTHEEQKAPQK